MATITPTIDERASHCVITWSGMATGDTINAAIPSERAAAHATLHLFGTWGGATVTLSGSLDGTNYDTMPDGAGTAISKTDDAVVSVGAAVTHYKPTIASGTSDSVTAVLRLWY